MKKNIVKIALALSLATFSSSLFAWNLYKDKGDVKLIRCNGGTMKSVSRAKDGNGWNQGSGVVYSKRDTWQEAADAVCRGHGG